MIMYATAEQKIERAGHATRWAAGADLGRGRTVRGASPKQVALIRRLANERAVPAAGKDLAEATILERVLDTLGGWTPNIRLTSDLIDYLMSLPMKETHVPAGTATPKATAFLTRLLAERQAPADFVTRCRAKLEAGISRQDASAAIDWLTRQPELPKAAAAEPVTPGVYKVGDEIFIVKPNREKTRVYAKRLVEIRGERLVETGEHVAIEFEYAPGAIHRIRPEHRMSVEEGKALTIRYGKCICCGRRLKAAVSVERGIGPVCITYFAR